MSSTLVIQSHTDPLPYPWLERCLQSVRQWSEKNHYDYRFLDDELFTPVADELLKKTANQTVIATDLARLYAIRQALQEQYETVVWLDADTLVFDQDAFVLPSDLYSLGREVWLQLNEKNRLKVFTKVHNAFLLFRRGNCFLEFYIESAEKLLRKNQGSAGSDFTASPQFIGPKLLTALHNIVQLPVLETAALFSPLLIKALLNGDNDILQRYHSESLMTPCAVNLCGSSCASGDVNNDEMEAVIDMLLSQGVPISLPL